MPNLIIGRENRTVNAAGYVRPFCHQAFFDSAVRFNSAATLPERCACHPDSPRNASKIPKVDRPIRIPNQAIVSGSQSSLILSEKRANAAAKMVE